ncbi:MAG: hypothetical protein RBR15_03535 [Sphaerochaeta sp.]|nr:hypothetical protein [Sphaerochaeta sp.]
MKRYLLIIYILVLSFNVGAAGEPASVNITLSTTAPGYLLHGFLIDPETTALVGTLTVTDAFNPDGAVLHYGIKTNTTIPLIVKAKISSFEEQDAPYPAEVPITRIEALSSSGPSTLDVGPEGTYNLLALTPTIGRVFYPYKLTVFVDQDTLLDAPVGRYVATVELHIEAGI